MAKDGIAHALDEGLDPEQEPRARSRSRDRRAKSQLPVIVRVSTLAADKETQLELSPDTSISNLKVRLQDTFGVPEGQQRLVIDDCILDGQAVLGDLAASQTLQDGRRCIPLTMVRDRGLLVLSGSVNGCLRLWDLRAADSEGPCVLSGHTSQVCGVEVDWETRRAVSGAVDDSTLWLWDLQQKVPLHRLVGHTGAVYGMAVDWDAARVLSWGQDCLLYLWDIECGSSMHALQGHADPVCDAEVGWEKLRAVSWDLSGVLWTWDLASGTAISMCGCAGPIQEVYVDWESLRGITVHDEVAPRFWDFACGEALRVFGGVESVAGGVAVDWEQQRVLSWGREDTGSLLVWTVDENVPAHEWMAAEIGRHREGVGGVEADFEKDMVISWGAMDHDLRLWTLASDVDPDASIADGSGALPLLSRCGCLLGNHRKRINGAHVDWDNLRMLSWSDDSTVRTWLLRPSPSDCGIPDVGSSHAEHVLAKHSGPIWSVEVDWRRQRALSWCFLDSFVILWNLEQGETLHLLALMSQGPWGGSVEVDWDRHRAVSWDRSDGDLVVWDLQSGAARALRGPEDSAAVVCGGREWSVTWVGLE